MMPIFQNFITVECNLSDRLARDLEFYTLQDKLNISKKIAGINQPHYCSHNSFNIIERLQELETINKVLDEQMHNIQVEIQLAENAADHQNDTSTQKFIDLKPYVTSMENIQASINVIKDNFNKLSHDRSFLPLIYPNYENYSRFVNHFDYNIFFLEKSYLASNPKLEQFTRFIFDAAELNKTIEIINGSYTPKDVINRLSQYFQIPTDKIALTYFNSRFGGFTVYPHPDNTAVNLKLSGISKNLPSSVGYFEDDPSWVFSMHNSGVIDSGIINEIDLWFDLDQAIAYIKDSKYPIDLNPNVSGEYDLNLDYLNAIFFDYCPEARELFRHDIINKIREDEPKYNPKHLEIFNGEEFELFNNYRIWSFSEYILVRYKVGEDITKQVCINTKDLYLVNTGFDYEDSSEHVLNVLKNNLKLLKISGYEKYNPYMIINDPSTSLEEMI